MSNYKFYITEYPIFWNNLNENYPSKTLFNQIVDTEIEWKEVDFTPNWINNTTCSLVVDKLGYTYFKIIDTASNITEYWIVQDILKKLNNGFEIGLTLDIYASYIVNDLLVDLNNLNTSLLIDRAHVNLLDSNKKIAEKYYSVLLYEDNFLNNLNYISYDYFKCTINSQTPSNSATVAKDIVYRRTATTCSNLYTIFYKSDTNSYYLLMTPQEGSILVVVPGTAMGIEGGTYSNNITMYNNLINNINTVSGVQNVLLGVNPLEINQYRLTSFKIVNSDNSESILIGFYDSPTENISLSFNHYFQKISFELTYNSTDLSIFNFPIFLNSTVKYINYDIFYLKYMIFETDYTLFQANAQLHLTDSIGFVIEDEPYSISVGESALDYYSNAYTQTIAGNYSTYNTSLQNLKTEYEQAQKTNTYNTVTSAISGFFNTLTSSVSKFFSGDIGGAAIGGFTGLLNTGFGIGKNVINMETTTLKYNNTKSLMEAQQADRLRTISAPVVNSLNDSNIIQSICSKRDYALNQAPYIYKKYNSATNQYIMNTYFLYGYKIQNYVDMVDIYHDNKENIDCYYLLFNNLWIQNNLQTILKSTDNEIYQKISNGMWANIFEFLSGGFRNWNKIPNFSKKDYHKIAF